MSRRRELKELRELEELDNTEDLMVNEFGEIVGVVDNLESETKGIRLKEHTFY